MPKQHRRAHQATFGLVVNLFKMPDGQHLQNLRDHFHRDMIGIYETVRRKCHYRANRFIQMVQDHGGVDAAKMLLNTPGYQYGFTELYLCGCLKYSMEALVLQAQYAELFEQHELHEARRRLEEVGYNYEH
jgi:hypothetical protein